MSQACTQNVFQNAAVNDLEDLYVEEKRNLAQFFFHRGGSESRRGDSHRFYSNNSLEDSHEEDTQSMSLGEVYEAFSFRHLPVSLEVLQT